MAKEKAEAVDYMSGMMGAAPKDRKSDYYLRLPKSLPLFLPKADVGYELVFFPWKAGKNNPAGAPGSYVWNRFLYVHQGIGPDNEAHLCPQKTQGKPCPICAQRAKYISANTDVWKDKAKKAVAKQLGYKNREVFLVHDLQGKENNLFAWEISTFCFGDHLRAWLQMKPTKYSGLISPKGGMVVEVFGTEQDLEGTKFTKYDKIQIVPLEKPLSKELVEKAAKIRLDDYVHVISPEDLKKRFMMAAVDDDDDDDDDELPEPNEDEDEDEEEEKKEEEDENEEEEEEPVKKKPESEPEEEEEEEDENEEEEEEEDENEEEEEEEGEEEDEKEPVKKKSTKKK